MGRLGNRLAWRVSLAVARRQGDPPVNEYRAALGLPPQQDCGLMGWRGAARVVILASPHYVGPAPPDWPPVTWGGFSVWDGPADRAEFKQALLARLTVERAPSGERGPFRLFGGPRSRFAVGEVAGGIVLVSSDDDRAFDAALAALARP